MRLKLLSFSPRLGLSGDQPRPGATKSHLLRTKDIPVTQATRRVWGLRARNGGTDLHTQVVLLHTPSAPSLEDNVAFSLELPWRWRCVRSVARLQFPHVERGRCSESFFPLIFISSCSAPFVKRLSFLLLN